MESIKRYRCIGPHNKSILYLTCYDSMVVATIFIGAHHKSFVVPDGDTDISLGEIRGEQFHFWNTLLSFYGLDAIPTTRKAEK